MGNPAERGVIMTKKLISVSKEFTETPGGRHMADGPYTGETFREKFLFPALQNYDQVEVDLDGTLGYGSSFLEEAFGGLIREKGMTKQELDNKLIIKSSRRLYSERIKRYIEDAQQVSLMS